MQKRNVNGALRPLANNLSKGIKPVPDETLEKWDLKHPGAKQVHTDLLLHGPRKPIYSLVHGDTNESFFSNARCY